MTSRERNRDVAPSGRSCRRRGVLAIPAAERAWMGGKRRQRRFGDDRPGGTLSCRDISVVTSNGNNQEDLALCCRTAPAPQSAEREDAFKSTKDK